MPLIFSFSSTTTTPVKYNVYKRNTGDQVIAIADYQFKRLVLGEYKELVCNAHVAALAMGMGLRTEIWPC